MCMYIERGSSEMVELRVVVTKMGMSGMEMRQHLDRMHLPPSPAAPSSRLFSCRGGPIVHPRTKAAERLATFGSRYEAWCLRCDGGAKRSKRNPRTQDIGAVRRASRGEEPALWSQSRRD